MAARKKPKAVEIPTLVAGIDIGSTAIRMKIAETLPDLQVRVLEELNYPVTTGADTYRRGYILPDTVHSICRILDDFVHLMDGYDVPFRRVVSSASVREAANSEILIDRIRHDAGLELEILDTVEESRLVYQALRPWLRQSPGEYSMTLNLGGGSTEMMVLRGEDLQMGGARRLGASRLFHSFGQGTPQARSELIKLITANIVNTTRDLYQEYHAARFLLVNRMLYAAFRSDPMAVKHENDFVIPIDALREHLKKAYSLGNLEISELFNVGLTEVELLIPAMLILDCFLEVTDVKEVTFTDTEMLTGLLREMAMSVGGENPLMSFHRQIVRSARAVGEKYDYDRAHSRIVTEFSLRIFDALTEFLDLDFKERLLLELAAVLHDIGMFIAEQRHHRHGAYLVQWADIVGLSEADRNLVAQIVFFHRKEIPSGRHPEFMALSQHDRMRVRKLAGILRLADVLDRAHRQNVKDLRIELSEGKFTLFVQSSSDIDLILDALPKKADLLEMVTGMHIELRREMIR